tara:strand:+ start:1259 stop:1579 length:321 start_codon:yes stop_codon:yes gene_type:complete
MSEQTNNGGVHAGPYGVTVHEMTVQQIRDYLRDAAKGQTGDLVDVLLLGDCELSTMKRMCSITDAQIAEFKPSQLQEIKAKCRELNPDFFGMLTKLEGLAKAQPAN